MDIKPFNDIPTPSPFSADFWSSMDFGTIMLIIAGIVVMIGVSFLFVYFDSLDFSFVSLIVGFGLVMWGMGGHDVATRNAYDEHYKNAVSELTKSLSDEGFNLVSGSPDLHPNTRSSLLLSYNEKLLDCTMFSPVDVNANIVFSCGDAKMTLTEIKEKK